MNQRWKKAQKVEASYRDKNAERRRRLSAEVRRQLSMEQQGNLARELQVHALDLLTNYALVSVEQLQSMRILEIGGTTTECALIGIHTPMKITIDPLHDPYERRDETCQYVYATGEYIPLPASSVDLCWCSNVIDHTSSPSRVLDEIRRVLTDNGILAIGCNTFAGWVYPFLPILNKFDKPHPHHFTEAAFERLALTNFDITTRFAEKWNGEIVQIAEDGKLEVPLQISKHPVEYKKNKTSEIAEKVLNVRYVTFRCKPKS
ncbi:class I SAM-dependent methyltransferase [Chloroflexota bacterium]